MAQIDEAALAPAAGPLAAALRAGLRTIDREATITFKPYIKVILPADGFIFWVSADIISPPTFINSGAVNAWSPIQMQAIPESKSVPGSLHFTTTNTQALDESFSINAMIFTATQPVDCLNDIAPGQMYIAEYEDFRFAFRQRTGFYRQADLHHYRGDAVYPVMESQIIDTPGQLFNRQIVSNSLPIFLALSQFCPMYPAMLVADNIRPPYCAIDVVDEQTSALQIAPYVDQTGTPWQLAKDRVRFTLFGLDNAGALDFQRYLLRASVDQGNFGFMSSPIWRDAKRGQVEISAIAMKKTMEVEVDYYQTTAKDLAVQLIKSAFVTFLEPN